MMTRRALLMARDIAEKESVAAKRAYMMAILRGTRDEENYFHLRYQTLRDEVAQWNERLESTYGFGASDKFWPISWND